MGVSPSPNIAYPSRLHELSFEGTINGIDWWVLPCREGRSSGHESTKYCILVPFGSPI